MIHSRRAGLLLAVLILGATSVLVAQVASARSRQPRRHTAAGHRLATTHRFGRRSTDEPPTATPIHHLVVVFQENVSFDHYFGTYPTAPNPPGEPPFHAAAGTPTVNGLSGTLLTNNPNEANPQRLDRSRALTCDQGHGYTAEQKAFDMGLMDNSSSSPTTMRARRRIRPPRISSWTTTTAIPSPAFGTTPSVSR
jgi:phospholipase C